MGSVIIAVVITLLVTAVVVYFVTTAYYKKVTEAKIGKVRSDRKTRGGICSQGRRDQQTESAGRKAQ